MGVGIVEIICLDWFLFCILMEIIFGLAGGGFDLGIYFYRLFLIYLVLGRRFRLGLKRFIFGSCIVYYSS